MVDDEKEEKDARKYGLCAALTHVTCYDDDNKRPTTKPLTED